MSDVAAENGHPKRARTGVLKSRNWQAELGDPLGEGLQSRAKLGFIIMCTETFMEAELHSMAPKGVGVNITRLDCSDIVTNETLLKHLDTMAECAGRIRPEGKSPDTICYSCTAGTIVMGEDKVTAEIKKGAPTAQPLTLLTSVFDALRELDVKKLVIGTPYLDEINQTELEVFEAKGFEVLDIQGLNVLTGTDMSLIRPDYLKKFALAIDKPEADCIFLSCGAIQSLAAVSEIEKITGKPCITSSGCQFWSSLRRAGVRDEIEGKGQLFKRPGKYLGPYGPDGKVDPSISK